MKPDFFEKLYVSIFYATPPEYIIVGSILCILFCIIFTKSIASYSRSRYFKKSRHHILSLFEGAQAQHQSFEIQVLNRDSNKVIASTILQEIQPDALVFETLTHVSNLLVGSPVDIFFRLREDRSTIYYKCHCKILTVDMLLMQRARLKVTFPNALTEGQKRNFFRIKPPAQSVRVLALWELAENMPHPRTTQEIGQPMFSFSNQEQQADTDEQMFMPVEDISGSGIGLRIPKPENAESLRKGMQLLCLLVYNESSTETKFVTFWCIGKVVNIRDTPDCKATLILGMEFSNWAVLEQGNTEIRWFNNSPTTGVGPITQWVLKMDLEQHKQRSL